MRGAKCFPDFPHGSMRRFGFLQWLVLGTTKTLQPKNSD
jgi:hypothetical protein